MLLYQLLLALPATDSAIVGSTSINSVSTYDIGISIELLNRIMTLGATLRGHDYHFPSDDTPARLGTREVSL